MYYALVIASLLPIVAGAGQPLTTRDQLQPRLQLEERVAPTRALLTRPSSEERRRITQAAVKFAEDIAGDNDVLFVLTVRRALRAGIEAAVVERRGRGLTDEDLPHSDQDVVGQSATTLDEIMVASERKFYETAAMDARMLVLGEPDVLDPEFPLDYFPDCVAVGNRESWCCSGVLIAPRVVLTAGHCFNRCADRVFVGESVDGEGRIYAVARKFRHPDYSGDPTYRHDVAVLLLDQDVTDVEPRPIVTAEELARAQSVRVVGFGHNNTSGNRGFGVRRRVDVPVASRDCDPQQGIPARYGCHPSLELVAGAVGLNADGCKGDSGGPAYLQVDGQWMLTATTSRATLNRRQVCGDGGVYVLTERHLAWIESLPGVDLPARP